MRRQYFILALVCWLIAIAIAFAGVAVAQDEDHYTTVQCADKCKMVDDWNALIKLEKQHYESLARLRDSLVHEPPGLVRSLDREATLKELQGQTSQLAQVLQRMLELERK